MKYIIVENIKIIDQTNDEELALYSAQKAGGLVYTLTGTMRPKFAAGFEIPNDQLDYSVYK